MIFPKVICPVQPGRRQSLNWLLKASSCDRGRQGPIGAKFVFFHFLIKFFDTLLYEDLTLPQEQSSRILPVIQFIS